MHARFIEPTYATLRVVSGGMFLFHGVQKIFGWLTTRDQPAFASQIWWGGLIELVCGVLIALGLFTRSAAFLASGTMAVAYFQFHWKLAFDAWKWLPIVNGGEMAALYCFLFLFICAKGPGTVSLDARRHRRRGSRKG